MNTDINYKFQEIKKKLNNELIGQKSYIDNLCNYFYEKIQSNEKGKLSIAGEGGTFKKLSVRLFFKEMGYKIEEIDLSSYSFNLGYNAFLTDLYVALNSDSMGILFKHTEYATKEILEILEKLQPNTCINLKGNYIEKNKFLVEADKESIQGEKIKEFVCHNKFLIFVYDNLSVTISNSDKVLVTKKLSCEERNKVIAKESLKIIKDIKERFNIEINIENESKYGLFTYLQEDYRIDGRFGVTEYISYRLYKPLVNLIHKEGLEGEGQLNVYVSENSIYCKGSEDIYNLNNYIVATIEEARYKLNSIIGINELKEFILNVENNCKVQKIRERLGLTTSKISMNMIFAGNAGTGKTNAARVTYEYFNALGILSKGVFREVSKADFVTENPSDTSKRTIEIINSALGGILFIDEAYSLCESDDDKVGKEIVDALLKGIEDNRDNLIVILAGYEKDMEEFLGFNQGLKSRFSNIIHFEDYTPTEMYEIAVNIAKSKGYRIADTVKKPLIDLFTRNQLTGKNDLGNARFVRNIVENAILDASKKYLNNKQQEIDLLERKNFNFKANAKFNLEDKLSQIIGLEEVKNLLRSQYKLIVAQEKRKSVGVHTKIEQNLNMVFAGNPGTGKTSIARLVAEMLSSMGLLKVGQLIETDRSSFVSEIPGETAKKTEAKFKEAIGGVLFIDEAYTLANDSIGREAIETLLKLIEDYSREVIVILAGYEEEMEDFFDVNIGLRSRFPLWTNFQDYNPNELLEMSIKILQAKGFKLSKNAYVALKKSFVHIYENSDAQSGNGRMVRNYVENLIRNQSIRIAENDISVYEMNLITTRDIEKVNSADYENEYDIEDKLKTLLGNEKSKEFLRNQYKFLKIKEKRRKLGIGSDINKFMNIVFTGDVGTGKKTVLNILADLYYSKGILKAKNMFEVNMTEIISLFKKGVKIDDILNKYLSKVLLINKFPIIAGDPDEEEIIAGMIKFLNNNHNKIIVVISGDKSKMKEIVLSNEALNYRFPTWVDFDDYQQDELYKIATSLIERKGYKLASKGDLELSNTIEELYNNKYLKLKNGLMVKLYLDQLIKIQSIRVCDDNISSNTINTIEVEDIIKSKKEFIERNTI